MVSADISHSTLACFSEPKYEPTQLTVIPAPSPVSPCRLVRTNVLERHKIDALPRENYAKWSETNTLVMLDV